MKRARILPASFLCLGITLTFVIRISQPLSAQSPKRKGVITGQVVTADGQPASEANVSAYAVGSSESEPQRADCDDEGNFKLTGLRPGSYIISAHMPGYVSLNDTSGSEIHRIDENVTLTLVKGGVITGRITDAAGEPMEGTSVELSIVQASQISLLPDEMENSFTTDDRGVYRIYGLRPGRYLVRVMDTLPYEYQSNSFRHNAPTYYPSNNRAAAAEITVRAGEEITGIDIRHLGRREHSISGVISGEVESESPLSYVSVTLLDEASGEELGSTEVIKSHNFALYGVADGTYELVAQRFDQEGSDIAMSTPRRVTVKGSDITGVDLKLLRLASISGRFILDPAKSGGVCGRPEKFSIEEVSLQIMKTSARDHLQNNGVLQERYEEGYLTAPNEKGRFLQKNLEAGVYRIFPDLPNDDWYLRSINRTSKTAARKGNEILRNGISLSPGENLTGIEIGVGRDAANIHGQIRYEYQAKEKSAGSLSWRVHIIPAEETSTEDLLRYAETVTRSDGSFDLKHVAPGKYFILAREIAVKESPEEQYNAVAWDQIERAKLRKEAQAIGQKIELRACQRINDYTFQFVKLK
jgi:carboxypeptidase family protein